MTGDFGKKDKNNKFYVIGRKENIIISGGKYLSSRSRKNTKSRKIYFRICCYWYT